MIFDSKRGVVCPEQSTEYLMCEYKNFKPPITIIDP